MHGVLETLASEASNCSWAFVMSLTVHSFQGLCTAWLCFCPYPLRAVATHVSHRVGLSAIVSNTDTTQSSVVEKQVLAGTFLFTNGFSSLGELLKAAEHYEAFHELTQGRLWKDETGQFLNLVACESLVRTYRLLSDGMLENKDYKQAIKILIKASEIAREGEWERLLSHSFP